jgi:YcxB-like protein
MGKNRLRGIERGDKLLVLLGDETDAVTVKFRLTSSDVFWALVRQAIRRMWFLLLLPILGSISIVWTVVEPNNGAVTLGQACWVFFVGAFLFGGLPYLQTRATMKAPNFGGLMILTVSGRLIQFTGEHSNGSIDGSMVKSVSETTHAILIHLKPAGIQIVPKRQLPQADVTAFKKVLRLHVSGKVRLAAA